MEVSHQDGDELGTASAPLPTTSPSTCTRSAIGQLFEGKGEAQESEASANLSGPGRLSHDHIKRSGNKRGSYAQCLDCNLKWKWKRALHRGIQFLTVATAFLSNCLGPVLDKQQLGLSVQSGRSEAPSSLRQTFQDILQDTGNYLSQEDFAQGQGPTSADDSHGSHGGLYRQRHGTAAIPVSWQPPPDLEDSFEDPHLPPGWRPEWDQRLGGLQFEWETFDG